MQRAILPPFPDGRCMARPPGWEPCGFEFMAIENFQRLVPHAQANRAGRGGKQGPQIEGCGQRFQSKIGPTRSFPSEGNGGRAKGCLGGQNNTVPWLLPTKQGHG